LKLIDKESSRRWRRRIREVLNSEWDPIGVADQAPDEYDSYIGKVAAMLREGASDEDLFQYLHGIETIHIGMPGNEARLREVIRSIRAIGFMN
jgi:hypothetical protein